MIKKLKGYWEFPSMTSVISNGYFPFVSLVEVTKTLHGSFSVPGSSLNVPEDLSDADESSELFADPARLKKQADFLEFLSEKYSEIWCRNTDEANQDLYQMFKGLVYKGISQRFFYGWNHKFSQVTQRLFRPELYKQTQRFDSAMFDLMLKTFEHSGTSLEEVVSQSEKLIATEKTREIAYSMDLLVPGFYFWAGGFKIALGGMKPEDEPYRYPGTLNSSFGCSVIFPGYHMLSTYRGDYDPRQASN